MSPDNNQSEPTTSTEGRKPKYTRLWLVSILLLGLGLRVAGLTWGQAFCYDSQGDCLDAYRVAVNYAQGEPRAQYIGQPNFNKHSKLPGPLWAVFCAAGLRLWGSIDGVVLAIILLNTAAIYLTFLLAARTVGFPAALWAALLMATSPEAVKSSVVVFNPAVMPFLGTLYQKTRLTLKNCGSRGFPIVVVQHSAEFFSALDVTNLGQGRRGLDQFVLDPLMIAPMAIIVGEGRDGGPQMLLA
jgi:hypothetical protein